MPQAKTSLQELLHEIRRIEESREVLTEKKIQKIYQSLSKDLLGYLGNTYAQYSDNDGRLTVATLKEKVNYAKFLEEIKNNVDTMTVKEKELINNIVEQTYQNCYEGMVKAVQKASTREELKEITQDINTNSDVLKQSIDNNINKLTLNSVLERHRADITYNIQQALTIGLMNGDRYDTIAKKISEVLGGVDGTSGMYAKAVKIARTETHRNIESGFLDCAENIQGKLEGTNLIYTATWRTMKDSRVRPNARVKKGRGWKIVRRGQANHEKMEGVVIKVGDKFDLGTYNGQKAEAKAPSQSGIAAHDCNCRCFLEYKIMTLEEFAKVAGRKEAEKVVQNSFAERMNKVKDRVNKKGFTTEDDLIEAGNIVYENLSTKRIKIDISELKNKNDVLYQEWKDLYNKKVDISKRINRLLSTDDEFAKLQKEYMVIAEKTDKAYEKWHKVYTEFKEQQEKYVGNAFDNAKELTNLLSQIRNMGKGDVNIKAHLNNSRSQVVKAIDKAYSCYPTDWVKLSANKGKLTPKKVSRGYYSNARSEIAISGYNEASQFQTAIHELGHRFERAVPFVLVREEDFYNRRTKGEALQWLGEGYRKDEKTRVDNFIEPYMGKDYNGLAYELVSMGFELAFTNPTKLWKDEEFAKFIYGILSLL